MEVDTLEMTKTSDSSLSAALQTVRQSKL